MNRIAHLALGALAALAGCVDEDSILSDMKEAKAQIASADSYYQRGDFARAIPLYEEGLKIRTKWGEPYKKLAISYEQTGQPDQAIRTYRKFLFEADSRDREVLAHLARLYENQGKLKDALEMNQRLLDLMPGHSEAKANVQRLQELLKQEQKPQ